MGHLMRGKEERRPGKIEHELDDEQRNRIAARPIAARVEHDGEDDFFQ